MKIINYICLVIVASGNILARDTIALNKASKELVQNAYKDPEIVSKRIAEIDKALANNNYDKCIKFLQSGLIVKEMDPRRDLIAEIAANKNLAWWEKKNLIDVMTERGRPVSKQALVNAYRNNDGHTQKLLEKKSKVSLSVKDKMLYSGPHLINGIRHKIF